MEWSEAEWNGVKRSGMEWSGTEWNRVEWNGAPSPAGYSGMKQSGAVLLY